MMTPTTTRTFTLLFAVAALGASGCSMFSKKPAQPKENPSISGQTEDSLRQRWIDRRAAELAAQGTAAEAARTQAEREFREKFPYTGAAKK
ncbi:MAG: hypothetical protein HZA93_24800 [Verrucomicrobia bacterium]|nr:hypothetical protein [Verrucomicrobiota bacterium]